MQSDQRVEEKKLGSQMFDGIDELGSIGVEVEPEGGGVDDVEVEGADVEIPAVADTLDSLPDHGGGVFSEVDEGGAFALHLEVSEARRSRGDAEGEVESEPGFAALGRAADDSHGLLPPEIFYEPSLREVLYRDVSDAPHDEGVAQGSSFLAATTWAEPTTDSSFSAAFHSALRARVSMARRFPRVSS